MKTISAGGCRWHLRMQTRFPSIMTAWTFLFSPFSNFENPYCSSPNPFYLSDRRGNMPLRNESILASGNRIRRTIGTIDFPGKRNPKLDRQRPGYSVEWNGAVENRIKRDPNHHAEVTCLFNCYNDRSSQASLRRHGNQLC